MNKGISKIISIIVPVYNKAEYVSECINSILSQTYKNIEVVIINDGSTDASANIIARYSDSRIKYIETVNSGVSNARNIGIKEATGDYIMFVDADDTIAPECCEILVNSIVENDVKLLVFGYGKIFNDGRIETDVPYCQNRISNDEFRETFMREMSEKNGIYGYVCNKLVGRMLLVENNIYFNKNCKLAEDLDFWLSVYSINPSIAFLQYAGYNYRQASSNSSIFQQQIDYWNLINVWLKCYKYLSPNSKGLNEILLRDKIGDLFKVIFLEMLPISIKNIRFQLTKIEKIKETYPFLNQNMHLWDFLKLLIYWRLGVGIYVYLKLRYYYHKIRI